MCFGVCTYTYAIGSISSVLSTLDSKKAKFKEKLGILDHLKREFNLGTDLYMRLQKTLKYDHSRNAMDRFEFLKELPQNLKLELSYIMHEEIIKQFPFFQGQPRQFVAYIGNTKIFDVKLGPLLRPLKIAKGEYIYMEGDIIDEIFFIIKGKVGFVLKNYKDATYVVVDKGSKSISI